GLKGTYFRALDQSRGIAIERIDPTIQFDWKDQQPHKGMNRDRFQIFWEGHLVPPVSGNYRFRMEVDDKATLKIDGRTVMRMVSTGKRDSGEVRLEAGTPVPISLSYQEEYSFASMKLFWQVPGQEMKIIPAQALLPLTGDREKEVVARSTALDPRGEERRVTVSVGRRGRSLELEGAAIPGLYQVKIPDQLGEEVEDLERPEVPMVVRRDVRESRLQPLEEDDKALIRKSIDLVEARNVTDLLAVLSGKGFGKELWKFLAIAAFFLLLLEVALARWISKSRRSGEDVNVELEEKSGPEPEILERMRGARQAE
ncbi:MAG: PA14 domain-containing protein, partial [Roseibacillus sp.]|nr:PA14 domain-containing protein [Roseibacillus sp.]